MPSSCHSQPESHDGGFDPLAVQATRRHAMSSLLEGLGLALGAGMLLLAVIGLAIPGRFGALRGKRRIVLREPPRSDSAASMAPGSQPLAWTSTGSDVSGRSRCPQCRRRGVFLGFVDDLDGVLDLRFLAPDIVLSAGNARVSAIARCSAAIARPSAAGDRGAGSSTPAQVAYAFTGKHRTRTAGSYRPSPTQGKDTPLEFQDHIELGGTRRMRKSLPGRWPGTCSIQQRARLS